MLDGMALRALGFEDVMSVRTARFGLPRLTAGVSKSMSRVI